jgi:hypothetical protein
MSSPNLSFLPIKPRPALRDNPQSHGEFRRNSSHDIQPTRVLHNHRVPGTTRSLFNGNVQAGESDVRFSKTVSFLEAKQVDREGVKVVLCPTDGVRRVVLLGDELAS